MGPDDEMMRRLAGLLADMTHDDGEPIEGTVLWQVVRDHDLGDEATPGLVLRDFVMESLAVDKSGADGALLHLAEVLDFTHSVYEDIDQL
jgi:hypothetical protein